MKKKDDGNRSGKRCGYNIISDNKISVAPTYADEFEIIFNDRAAVNNLLDMMTQSCHTLLKPITARQKNLWDRMSDDYGFDIEKNDYSYANGVVTITPKPTRAESEG